ncbi:RNA polymerase II-associated protein 1-like [Achroia grisella]|uniref:RNA polymerase II-associated protein 1-like n=1 Tax=Achroia grisella TaxID=688607 RepID=UPI0027D3417C|nr:RNA polymerase II-associated protein 1-like [Achroia grisella]
MFKRPCPGDDEDDILKMQEEFFREKSKNQNMQPAAQVTNLRRTELKRVTTSETGARKQSKYAESKGLNYKRSNVESGSALLGDVLEKNTKESEHNDDDDKVYFPKIQPSVLGDIVEKNVDESIDFVFNPMPAHGFPAVMKRTDHTTERKDKTKGIKVSENSNMEIDELCTTSASNQTTNLVKNFPTRSYILSSSDANNIHDENLKTLTTLSEKEILEEQQKLLSSLDPKLIQFLKSKREHALNNTKDNKQIAYSPPVHNIVNDDNMDTSESFNDSEVDNTDAHWENDVLSHPDVNTWLHFDSLEKDKLEWIKGIVESRKIKPDEPYEARFDFKGYLLPYTMEYTEKTKTLFHHGEEPHRPGYTLLELFELSRSAVTQQRVMALNTIAGVLEYYMAGTYKDIIDIPLTKIFFILRFAIDENKTIILEPALKGMRNLLYNRIDEASLDALLGFEEGTRQPCLENDKSEIEELESKESELNDFHLAEIDLIAAAVRSDIIQRLFYILDTIRPSFNCVQYCLQIFIRLIRDSDEIAMKIVQTEHLMSMIIQNFIPASSLSFAFVPQIVYKGKPILAALKFLRILSLQSRDVGEVLVNKYGIIRPLFEYISSGVDGTYGLRIQIEAYCIVSNLLQFNLAIEDAMSLSPIIVTSLYKHVKGSDVFIKASVVSATHAAVVIQLVNNLLNCNSVYLENFKHQVYPLLKEGVQKWFAQLSCSDAYTCGHLRLLSSALDCCVTILLHERVPLKFLSDALKEFIISKGFKEILKNVVPCSNLLSGIENKDLHFIKNLRTLGTSVIDSAQKVLPVLNVVSPIPFLVALLNVLRVMEDKELSTNIVKQFHIYLKNVESKAPSLCDNWFTRMEVYFLFSVIKIAVLNDIDMNDDILYAVSNKLCYILRIDKKYELEFLFNAVVFNKKWFAAERLFNLMSLSNTDSCTKVLPSIINIKRCYRKVINFNYRAIGPSIVLRKWQEPILPRDWIYLPILMLYSRSQEADLKMKTEPTELHPYGKAVSQELDEKDSMIACSLGWILLNEQCYSDLLNDIDLTDRFCRIMCVFLCDNSLFLNADIKDLLHKCTQVLFKKNEGFNFDKELTGLNNFQDFYTQFLEQFQSVSYGDATFAACVLVPIAQKHNVKWRKLLWSEYAGCLRALDCPEDSLCYEMKDYLYPEETDESLLKSYGQALSTNLLRPDTVAYRIARHHFESFKNRNNVRNDE